MASGGLRGPLHWFGAHCLILTIRLTLNTLGGHSWCQSNTMLNTNTILSICTPSSRLVSGLARN